MLVALSVDQVLDDGDLAFGDGVRDAVTYVVGNRTFVYLVGGTGGGLTALEVLANGSLAVVDETPLSGSFALGVEPRLLIAMLDGIPTLVISGQTGALARSIRLESDGTFGTAGVLAGDPAALGQPSLVAGPDGEYLVAASATGLVSYAVGSGPSLSQAATLEDTGATFLSNIADTTSVVVDGLEYVAAASATEAALTVVAVGPGGALSRTGDVGAPDGLGVSGLATTVAAHIEGRAFVVFAGTGSSSISVAEVQAGGIPILRDHVVDALGTRFDAVETLATLTVDGRTFVAAGGADDGVSLFTLTPRGRLVHLASLEDTTSSTMADVSAITLAESDGALEVLVSGLSKPGITRLSVDLSGLGATLAAVDTGDTLTGTADDDLLAGGMFTDQLDGSVGNDILVDGGGSDTLTGGSGADLFVLDADGQIDTITDFEAGVDLLDLSSFPLLYDPSQLVATAQSWGVRLAWKSEVIDLYSASGGSIDISGWSSADILNLDRPQSLPISQVLSGDNGDNTLRGGEGADTILGGGGVDTIEGEGGADQVEAGTGNDLVTGGSGDDRLFGDAGFDTMHGGTGNDKLWGGNEADSLIGDAGDDILYGELGVDNLFGEDGADSGYGGPGNDWIFGGAGADTLYGDTQEDRLFGEDGADLLYGGAGFDRLEGGVGEDILWGGAQADNLFGNTENDTLYGEGGFDRLFGGTGNDDLYAGDGPDALFGETGDDLLYAGTDDDRLFGGQGNDTLYGEAGADNLSGDAGFDTLIGGAGNDTLSGKFNADTFVFADGDGNDVITDFDRPNDFEKIDLSALSNVTDFADLSANHLTQSGADAVIDDGVGTTITLLNITAANLAADDFIF